MPARSHASSIPREPVHVTPWLPAAVVLALLTLGTAFVAAGAAPGPEGMALPVDAPGRVRAPSGRSRRPFGGATLRAHAHADRGPDHHRAAHDGAAHHRRTPDHGGADDHGTTHHRDPRPPSHPRRNLRPNRPHR